MKKTTTKIVGLPRHVIEAEIDKMTQSEGGINPL